MTASEIGLVVLGVVFSLSSVVAAWLVYRADVAHAAALREARKPMFWDLFDPPAVTGEERTEPPRTVILAVTDDVHTVLRPEQER